MGRRSLVCVVALCGCSDSGSSASWQAVTEGQPAALLSVWAASPTDAWTVGGNPSDNSGPLVFHYDGTAWTKKSTGLNVNLWWVTGWSDGTVFVSGENSTILRYHPDSDTFETMTPPKPGMTIFGMWGASPSDVWAVGGVTVGGGAGVVWHFDGAQWSDETPIPVAGASCFKVNGSASDDVWISASNGVVMHWTGAMAVQMIPDAVEQQAPLLSIGTNGSLVIAVGGASVGVLYENDGSGWKSGLSQAGNILRGVAVGAHDAYAVGDSNTILHRGSSGSWATDKAIQTGESFHADFIDSAGGVWVAGGDFQSPMTSAGVLLHKGTALQGGF